MRTHRSHKYNSTGFCDGTQQQTRDIVEGTGQYQSLLNHYTVQCRHIKRKQCKWVELRLYGRFQAFSVDTRGYRSTNATCAVKHSNL